MEDHLDLLLNNEVWKRQKYFQNQIITDTFNMPFDEEEEGKGVTLTFFLS